MTLNDLELSKDRFLVYAQTEGRGRPRNLDNFAAVSRRVLQTVSRNLAKFSAENWAYFEMIDGYRTTKSVRNYASL